MQSDRSRRTSRAAYRRRTRNSSPRRREDEEKRRWRSPATASSTLAQQKDLDTWGRECTTRRTRTYGFARQTGRPALRRRVSVVQTGN
jgi:hypothetical protein